MFGIFEEISLTLHL